MCVCYVTVRLILEPDVMGADLMSMNSEELKDRDNTFLGISADDQSGVTSLY